MMLYTVKLIYCTWERCRPTANCLADGWSWVSPGFYVLMVVVTLGRDAAWKAGTRGDSVAKGQLSPAPDAQCPECG